MIRATNPSLGPAALALGALLLAATPSRATLYIVRTTADVKHGSCAADCSLRDAIIAANAHAGYDYVTVPAGTYLLTIPGTNEDLCANGDLDITDDLFITGAGPSATIITALGLGERVLDVQAPAGHLVTINGLTITDGSSTGDGGGIADISADLVVGNVVIAGNSAMYGAGISAFGGNVTVQEGSVVRANFADATHEGGGIYHGGNSGGLTVTDSTISGNWAYSGAGIFSNAPLDVTGSTIASNTAILGGGVFVGQYATGSEIANSTLYGNSSTHGGGLYVASSADVSLHSVTFADNDASEGPGICSYGHFTLTNTLVADGCERMAGNATSNGGNLESPNDTCGMNPAIDQVNVADPKLAPLAANGGLTWTMLPQVGSPAINHGTSSYCLAADQRGEPRSDGICDTGAVERQTDDPLFADGFEAGSAAAWSSWTP